MRVLVDTNILLRSAQPNHSLFPQAQGAVSKLLRQGESLFFCAQNIAEFWCVATRPAGENGLGMKTDEVLKEIDIIEKVFNLLPDIPGIYPEWKRIVAQYRVEKVQVFDARLVAVMKLYSVDHILTFNGKHFDRYANITALQPAVVLSPNP
jgi:predicted nucleic acid-binding protein